jgi:NAD(P)-dependent dehydrogenase (short-subunit alcohol dehydrogenase family)
MAPYDPRLNSLMSTHNKYAFDDRSSSSPAAGATSARPSPTRSSTTVARVAVVGRRKDRLEETHRDDRRRAHRRAVPASDRQPHPAGRPAQPEDIAPAVLFLASEDAHHVTGAVLAVDGGTSASTGQPHLE